MSDSHRAIEELLPCVVPTCTEMTADEEAQSEGEGVGWCRMRAWRQGSVSSEQWTQLPPSEQGGRTNLMATVCELSRFVPAWRRERSAVSVSLYERARRPPSRRRCPGPRRRWGEGGEGQTFEDNTERALADLLPDTVVGTDYII